MKWFWQKGDTLNMEPVDLKEKMFLSEKIFYEFTEGKTDFTLEEEKVLATYMLKNWVSLKETNQYHIDILAAFLYRHALNNVTEMMALINSIATKSGEYKVIDELFYSLSKLQLILIELTDKIDPSEFQQPWLMYPGQHSVYLANDDHPSHLSYQKVSDEPNLYVNTEIVWVNVNPGIMYFNHYGLNEKEIMEVASMLKL